MSTIYQQILVFEAKNPNFQFNEKGIDTVGLLCAKKWREQGGRMSQLDKIPANEKYGSYEVLDYPNSFTEDIQETIKSYVQIVIAIGKRKKQRNLIVEKPKTSVAPPKKIESVPTSSTPPEPRKRKRIPLKQPASAFRRSPFKN